MSNQNAALDAAIEAAEKAHGESSSPASDFRAGFLAGYADALDPQTTQACAKRIVLALMPHLEIWSDMENPNADCALGELNAAILRIEPILCGDLK